MPSLNDIEHEIKMVLDTMEYSDPEHLELLQQQLDSYLEKLGLQEGAKADSVAAIIRQSVARINYLKEEEQRIKNRRQSAEKQLARTKAYFQGVMEFHGLKSIKGESSTLSIRRSEQVVVNNPEYIPENFKRIKTTIEADKAAIKEALKSGEEIEGCYIVENFSLNVR